MESNDNENELENENELKSFDENTATLTDGDKSEKDVKFNLEFKFKQFMKEIKSNMSKCRYRKVLDDITLVEDFFDSVDDGWKVNEMRIRCMLKIVYKKILKYENSFNNSIYSKSIENWFIKIDTEIEEWINGLPMNDDRQTEIVIQLFLEELYLNAVYSNIDKKYQETAAFLGLGEKIIKEFTEFSRDNKTLNISEKIILFLSSLMIADNDFETAKIYQATCLKLCFRELFLLIDLTDGLNYKKISKSSQHSFDKIFINIIIAFYQRGACEENLGFIKKAVECYKQSKWFATKFIGEKIPDLVQFMFDLEKRAYNYNKVIKDLKEKSDNAQRSSMKNEEELAKEIISNDKLEKLEKLASIAQGRTVNMNKYDDTLKNIENLKFPEFEFDTNKKNAPVSNKEFILSTLHLIDNLMDDGFKDILKDIKDLKINHIDSEIQHKFQKRINELRAEKNLINRQNIMKKNSLELDNKSSTSIKIMNRSKSVVVMNNDLINSYEKKGKGQSRYLRNSSSVSTFATNLNNKSQPKSESCANIINQNYKEFNSANISNFNFAQKPKIYSARPYCAYNPGSTEKFHHDDYTLSRTFRNKINYLKKVNDREISFQKKLLKLKKNEFINVRELDPHRAKEEAEFFFKRELNAATSTNFTDPKNKKLDFRKDSAQFRNDRKKEILQNLVIKSLNSQSIKKFSNFIASQEKHATSPKGEFMNKYNEMQCKVFSDRKNVEKRNNEVIKKIDIDLDLMKKENEYYDKILRPLKYTRTSKSAVYRNIKDNINSK